MNANIQKTLKKIKNCPTCGAPLFKVHRNIFYKLMSGFIYSRRYKCSNKDCQFEDLKISKKVESRVILLSLIARLRIN